MNGSKVKLYKMYGVLLLISILFLTACSSDKPNIDEKSEEQTERESQSPKFTLENDGIDEEAFQEVMDQLQGEAAERVVTTSVPLTEMLHILGVTPVGVPTSSNPIPEDFKGIDEIGSPMAPDLEVMTSLKPDLVLSAKSLQSSIDQSLIGMDMEKAYLPTDSFGDLKLSFKALGTYFNQTEKMNEKLQSILEKENELIERAEGEELPKVLLMMGTSESFMVMNEKSYLGSLVQRIGADNIATSVLKAKDTYSPMNMEEVVVADPDIIFVLASGDHGASEEMFNSEVENNDLWKNLSAFKNDNIHILDHQVFGVTSIEHVETALTGIADYFFE